MGSLPKATIKRIIKEKTNMRVSEDAVEELRARTDDYLDQVSRTAGGIADKEGKKTVQGRDIEQADNILY